MIQLYKMSEQQLLEWELLKGLKAQAELRYNDLDLEIENNIYDAYRMKVRRTAQIGVQIVMTMRLKGCFKVLLIALVDPFDKSNFLLFRYTPDYAPQLIDLAYLNKGTGITSNGVEDRFLGRFEMANPDCFKLMLQVVARIRRLANRRI